MNTGINIPDEVRAEFQALRLKRKYRYIIMKVNDAKDGVEVEKTGAREETFDEFKENMPKNNSRWAVYDLEWNADDGRKLSKLLFILFAPDDNADKAERFVVTCNKDQVKSKMSETNRDMQVNSWDDLNQDKFIAQFS